MSGWIDYGYEDALRFKARIPILGAYLALNDREAFSSPKLSKKEVAEKFNLVPFVKRGDSSIFFYMNSLLSITKQITPRFIDHTRTSVTTDRPICRWTSEVNFIYWNWQTLCEAAGDNPENYLERKKFNLRSSVKFFIALKDVINLLLYKWDYLHDKNGNDIYGNGLGIAVHVTGTYSDKEARFVGARGYYSYTDGTGNMPAVWMDSSLGYSKNVTSLYQNTAQPNIRTVDYILQSVQAASLYSIYDWYNICGYSHDSTYSYWDMSLVQEHLEFSCFINGNGEKLGIGDIQFQLYAITEYSKSGQATVRECVPVTATLTNGECSIAVPETHPPEEPSGGTDTTLTSSSSKTHLSLCDLNGYGPDYDKLTKGIFLYVFKRIPAEFL